MGKVKHRFSVYTELGKLVGENLNSREATFITSGGGSMNGQTLNLLKNGEVVRIKSYFLCQTNMSASVEEAVKNLKSARICLYEDKLKRLAYSVMDKTVLKVDEFGNHLGTYFMCTLNDVADDLKLPLGTVKAKLHKDPKIIRKKLDGIEMITSSEYRLIYLEDLINL